MAIREFSGEARLTAGAIETGSLQLTINAGSLAEAGPGFSDADRKKIDHDIHEKALEVSKYPQIVFKSTVVSAKKVGEGQYQVRIVGALTLHGVTKPVEIPANVAFHGNTVTARGEFTIRHTDYRIERLSAAAGTVKAGDEITLTFTLVAAKT